MDIWIAPTFWLCLGFSNVADTVWDVWLPPAPSWFFLRGYPMAQLTRLSPERAVRGLGAVAVNESYRVSRLGIWHGCLHRSCHSVGVTLTPQRTAPPELPNLSSGFRPIAWQHAVISWGGLRILKDKGVCVCAWVIHLPVWQKITQHVKRPCSSNN